MTQGKHLFLAKLIPQWDSPRPSHISLNTKWGRTLIRWLLSEHMLEIEVGRYSRTPRQQCFCRRCFTDLGVEILGDEFHALNYCVRAQAHRFNTAAKIRSHLERYDILVDAV